MEKELVERAWNISPDTVFGALVALMLSLCIYLILQLRKKDEKLVELNVSTIEVLKDLNTSLLLLKDEGVNMTDRLSAQLASTREHISDKIETLKYHNHAKQ